MRLSLLALALLCSTPAFAQANDADSWVTMADTVRVSAAGIALPQQAGPVALAKTGEISDPGTGMNSYARYVSPDEVVQASVFIYRPGYADTTLAALGTERAILERFGPGTRRAAQTVLSAGGTSGAALRILYEGAAGGELALASAFVQAGPWMVKLRVTATRDRAADVKAAVDALVAGLAFDAPATLKPARTLAIHDCAARDASAQWCRRDVVAVGEARFDVLQSAQAGSQGAIFIPTDDAAGLLRFDPLAGKGGYRLTRYGIGGGRVAGDFATLPSTSQIAALIDGKDATALASRASSGDGTTVLRESIAR